MEFTSLNEALIVTRDNNIQQIRGNSKVQAKPVQGAGQKDA